MSDEPKLTADGVVNAFRAVLLREPENKTVVAHYLRMNMSLTQLVVTLTESNEFRERQRRLVSLAELPTDSPPSSPLPPSADGPRVLLFGAYGNGNVGDTAQAASLTALIRPMAPRNSSPRFAAISWERRQSYAVHGAAVLRPDALLRPEHIRPRVTRSDGGGADLVVIGGGGLLGAPHFPLHERRWTEWFVARQVPFAFVGVGGSAGALAEAGWRDAYQMLLRNAVYVGVRDDETLQAARASRPDATWFPDPVLAQALMSKSPAAGERRGIEAVLIPRAPNDAADRAALGGVLALAAELRSTGRRVVIASLEPSEDRRALRGEEVQYIETWEEMLALCAQARMVLSARYHGVIAGLASGCAVHGLAQPKTGDLMRRLGVQAWFHAAGWPATPPDISAAAAGAFHDALEPGLASFRSAVDGAVQRLRGAIGPALGSASGSTPAAKRPGGGPTGGAR